MDPTSRSSHLTRHDFFSETLGVAARHRFFLTGVILSPATFEGIST